MPVEIGLAGIVEVEVVLARERPPVLVDGTEWGPGGPAELGDPVRGQLGGPASPLPDGADVEVVAIALLAGQGPLEPLVLGRGVVEHHVEHDPDAVGAQSGDEIVEVLQGAHGGIDGAVVGHVVAVVASR